MKTKLVFALGIPSDFNDNGVYVFGKDGGLPWSKHKKDMETFKHETMYTLCLMGSKTFSSLPFALPERVNIVLGNSDCIRAKNGDRPDMMYDTLEKALEDAEDWYFGEIIDQDRWLSVIGGLGLITEFLENHRVDEIIISYIPMVQTLAEIDADIVIKEDDLLYMLRTRQAACFATEEYYDASKLNCPKTLRIMKYEVKNEAVS